MASSKCEVRVNGLVVEGLAQKASADYPKAVDLFYGIPFARIQRFKAAMPIALDEASPVGRLVASKAEPMSASPMLQAPTTEDPLRLNIVRPATAKEKAENGEEEKTKTPVIVYLHGGGFNFSNPLERDHAAFVAYADKDVLLVSVSYRLGALGFLAGGGGSSSSEERNLGLRDQRVAVEWVRRWIGFFGGNAEDLTMLGVSAGAHSVSGSVYVYLHIYHMMKEYVS
jgi:carboxylesterase type B